MVALLEIILLGMGLQFLITQKLEIIVLLVQGFSTENKEFPDGMLIIGSPAKA